MNDYLNSENDSFDLLGYYCFFSIFGNEIVKVKNTATRRFFFIFSLRKYSLPKCNSTCFYLHKMQNWVIYG